MVFGPLQALALLLIPAWAFQSRYFRCCKFQNLNSQGNDEEFRDALEIAKQYDSEWLARTLDYNSMTNFSKTSNIVPPNTPPKQPNVISTPISVDSFALETLQSLGYSINEINSLKTSIRQILTKKKINRPQSGIPLDWIEQAKPDVSESVYENDVRTQKPVTSRNDRDGDYEEEGSSRTRSKTSPVSEKKATEVGRKSEERKDLEEVVYDEGSQTFWPDKEEFKDMLLDESKWRIDVVGPWVAPLVREETKLRFSLYKKWLEFLDQGFGDSFDVMDDGFDVIEDDNEDETEGDERKVSKSPRAVRESTGDSVADRKAAKYEKWLRSQLEETEWEDKAKTETLEGMSRTKEATYSVSNKKDWFEDEDEEHVKDKAVPSEVPKTPRKDSPSKSYRQRPQQRFDDVDDV